MHPVDLERAMTRELAQLPVPRAPLTLVPRVMAAVQAWANRPWYERAWFMWPHGWQVASAAALLLLVAAAALWIPRAEVVVERLASTLVSGATGDLIVLGHRAAIAISAARIIWRTAVEPFVPYAFVIVALMCAMCAACGTALNRVAELGRT